MGWNVSYKAIFLEKKREQLTCKIIQFGDLP